MLSTAQCPQAPPEIIHRLPRARFFILLTSVYVLLKNQEFLKIMIDREIYESFNIAPEENLNIDEIAKLGLIATGNTHLKIKYDKAVSQILSKLKKQKNNDNIE